MKILNSLALASVAVAISFTSCKKDYLDRKPTTQIAFDDVFSTVEGARAAVNGIHRTMYEFGGGQHYEFGQASINFMYDLMGDDVKPYAPGHFDASYSYQGARTGTATAGYTWGFYYGIINNANFIISNIDGVKGAEDAKAEVKAQALFYRAYAYYNLANCYMFSYASGVDSSVGGEVKLAPCVPIYTEPTQVAAARASVAEVYKFITDDLTESIRLFDTAQISRTDKSQINIDVAKGLAARVYLIMQDWSKAEMYAREARQAYPYMAGSDLLKGFNDINSSEWLWGSAINSEQATSYASFVSFMDKDSRGYALVHGPIQINEKLHDTIPATDVRKDQFITRAKASIPGTPYLKQEQRKFRIRTKGSWVADYPLMRSAELALIEAEALVHMRRVNEGAKVLEDFVKTRNPEYEAPQDNAEAVIAAIWLQRRIELWGEGLRFFDIKRSCAQFANMPKWNSNQVALQRVDFNSTVGAGVRTLQKNDVRFLFRIPSSELLYNPLCVQNP